MPTDQTGIVPTSLHPSMMQHAILPHLMSGHAEGVKALKFSQCLGKKNTPWLPLGCLLLLIAVLQLFKVNNPDSVMWAGLASQPASYSTLG